MIKLDDFIKLGYSVEHTNENPQRRYLCEEDADYNRIETGKSFGSPSTWAKIKEVFGLKDSEMYTIQNEGR